MCNKGFFGDGCSLGSGESAGDIWHWLWRGGKAFTPRTSHASVYIPELDRLYVFGGYNLNEIYGDLMMLDLMEGIWSNLTEVFGDDAAQIRKTNSRRTPDVINFEWLLMHPPIMNSSLLPNLTFTVNSNNTVSVKMKTPSPSSDKKSHRFRRMIRPGEEINSDGIYGQNLRPTPRYGHAMERYLNHFVLYGGKLKSGKVSSELWLYNTTTESWSLISSKSSEDKNESHPPGLMHFTLTLVDNYWIYLFGGSLEHGEFSSDMYKLNIAKERKWSKVIIYFINILL